jgi:nitrogen fixation-related uncharacterized protein
MEPLLTDPTRTEDPKKTAAAVRELERQPKAVKRAIKLDHALVMSEVQLLLADKRTAFALLRTGVTVALVPVSIWTVLVATSKLWDPFRVLWLLLPVMGVAVLLFALGLYLIWHAIKQVQHIDHTMQALRSSDTLLEDLLYRETTPGFWWRSPR